MVHQARSRAIIVCLKAESLPNQKKSAPPKKAPKDARTQSERFEEFAREHGAVDDVLDRALSDVAAAKPKKD